MLNTQNSNEIHENRVYSVSLFINVSFLHTAFPILLVRTSKIRSKFSAPPKKFKSRFKTIIQEKDYHSCDNGDTLTRYLIS